jgi:hypothetical protein
MEKKSYYYRTLIKSALGKELRSLYRACERAEAAADRFVTKVGAKRYYPHPNAFAGGVVCVGFDADTTPSDKLWQSIGKDGDGDEMWVPRKYTEQDVPHDLHHPKRKLPYYIRESQRIEKERQTLPMVRLERFFKLLQTNLMADVPENKTVAFIQPETPMIFSFDGYYYIGITYPCAAEGLQPVTQEAFMAKREDLLRVQRDMEAMNDGEHLS